MSDLKHMPMFHASLLSSILIQKKIHFELLATDT